MSDLALPTGPYDVIYCDPPWSYRGRKQFGFAGDVGVCSGGAVQHYQTMSVDDLCALPVESIAAEDALLFMWMTSPCLPDGMRVMAAWGFTWATIAFVWDKSGGQSGGTNPGYYTMSQVEICAVGKRGRIPQPRGSRNERQMVTERRGKHSAKPAEVRERITRMFPLQRRVELFARERVAGWDAWGNECPDEITPERQLQIFGS